jgi:hypothetical protein
LLDLEPAKRVGDIGGIGRQFPGARQHHFGLFRIAALDQPAQIVQGIYVVRILLENLWYWEIALAMSPCRS